MPDYPDIAQTLTDALKLRQPPIAVCLHVGDTVPGGVSTQAPHNLDTTEAHEVDRRISELAKANEVLTSFHARRRRDIEAGGHPTIQESLTRLQAQKS